MTLNTLDNRRLLPENQEIESPPFKSIFLGATPMHFAFKISLFVYNVLTDFVFAMQSAYKAPYTNTPYVN